MNTLLYYPPLEGVGGGENQLSSSFLNQPLVGQSSCSVGQSSILSFNSISPSLRLCVSARNLFLFFFYFKMLIILYSYLKKCELFFY